MSEVSNTKGRPEIMQNLNLKLLSEALGEVARGFKKLKLVVDGVLKSGEKLPEPEISGILAPEETGGDQEENGSFTPDTKVTPPVARTQDECAKFLIASKVQLPKLGRELFFHIFEGTLRADRFHNQWVADATAKKGWRKISETQLEKYRNHYKGFHNELLGFWYHFTRNDFVKEYGNAEHIHIAKWNRLKNLERMDMSKKKFRKLCCDAHASLPPLR